MLWSSLEQMGKTISFWVSVSMIDPFLPEQVNNSGLPQLTFTHRVRDAFPLMWLLRQRDADMVLEIWGHEILVPLLHHSSRNF